MSFLKSLFGFGSSSREAPAAEAVDYKGFVIRPAPYLADGQYQTAGTIEKEIGGTLKQHRFVRADRHPTLEAATAFSLDKARQIVDLQGERIFG